MRTYIMSIAASTVLCAVVNIITPKNWSKYVGIVTGFVVIICIAQPIISLFNITDFDGFSYTAKGGAMEGEAVLYSEIKTELENRINQDAQDRLRRDFNRDCVVKSEVKTTKSGKVEGVSGIFVYGDRIDAVVIGKLRDVYGAEEVKYCGTEKTTEKSE